MFVRLAAASLVMVASCAKKEEAPMVDAVADASMVAALEDEPAATAEAVFAEPAEAEIACPALDTRDWKAWTSPSGDGHTLTIEGEIDLPTPGYALIWRAGIADRAMPPGLRVHLDAVPPADLVMQVVTPTPVSWSMDRANPQYRIIYVLCGDETIGEIADVGPKR